MATEEKRTTQRRTGNSSHRSEADSAQLQAERREPWRSAVLRLVAGGVPREQWPPFECCPGDTPRRITEPSRLREVRQQLSRLEFDGTRRVEVPKAIVDRVRSAVSARVIEDEVERMVSDITGRVAVRVAREGASSDPEVTRIADSELTAFADSALDPDDPFKFRATHLLRFWHSDTATGTPFGVASELYFDRHEVDALVASVGPREQRAHDRKHYFSTSMHAFLFAEDGSRQLKRSAIDPDDWPELYWRDAERLGRLRPANRVDAEQWKRKLFSGELDSEYATQIVRRNSRSEATERAVRAGGYRLVELYMLEPSVAEVLRAPDRSRLEKSRWHTDLRQLFDENPAIEPQAAFDRLSRMPGYGESEDGKLVTPQGRTVTIKSVQNRLSELHR